MKTISGKFRAALLMAAAASALVFASGAMAQNQNGNGNGGANSNDNTWPYATTGKSPVLAVVGDVACQPVDDQEQTEKPNEACVTIIQQSQQATAAQIESMKPDLVALVGDEQYQVGQFQDFEQSYNLTYGGFKMITRPSPGNHEFYNEHGAIGVAGYGYFSYFNGTQYNSDGTMMMATVSNTPDTDGTFTQPVPYSDGQAGHFEQSGGLGSAVYANGPSAGTAAPDGVGDGWYSYDLGSWHLISLNIECETQPGGCSDTGSWFAAELAWLKNDLATNHSACTLAYWHQPTFSATNGISLEGITAKAFWELLYQYGADLVLNGHDHLYARYRPLDPNGNFDPKKGIREFIVGTGGETLDPVITTTVTSGDNETNMEDPTGNTSFNAENLEKGSGFFWGVMALTLNQNGYAWNFQSALKDTTQSDTDTSFMDQGVGACHGGSSWAGGNNLNGN